MSDGPAGGVVISLESGDLFFLGIRESLLDDMARQSLKKIATYQTGRGSEQKSVECNFSEGSFRKLRIPLELKSRARQYGSYFYFRVSGWVHYSDSGVVFGVLPSENIEKRSFLQ